MLQRADNVLIDDLFQPLAHRAQRLTGKTNFWLAKWACILGCIALLFTCVQAVLFFGIASLMGKLVVFLLLTEIFLAFFHIRELEREDRRFSENREGVMNKERIIGSRKRAMMLILLLFFITFLLPLAFATPIWGMTVSFVVAEIAYLSYYYFHACTPLPPGESKARKWLGAFLAKLNEKLSPMLEPSSLEC